MSDIEKLKEARRLLSDKHDFQAGNIVRWKRTLRNRRFPKVDQPAIVVERLPEPVTDKSKDAATSLYREPLDIILGIMDEDGEFSTYHFDSRRFELWETSE